METEIITLLVGFLVTSITQISKKYFKGINPQLLVVIFSCIIGGTYCLIGEFYDLKVLSKFVLKSFSVAVVVYSVLKQFAKIKK